MEHRSVHGASRPPSAKKAPRPAFETGDLGCASTVRAKWKGVLAAQTGNIGVTNRYIAGINRYIREHAPALRITDLFDELAVAGYFGSNFTNALKAKVFRWMDQSESRWQAGQEPTKYSYFNRIVNEDITDARHTGMAYSVNKLGAIWQAQMIIADANGLGLIQYEGGNGNERSFHPPS